MINYTEKGIELHEALADAGLSLYEHDGVWVTDSDPVQVQAFIDSFTPSREVQLEKINRRCDELLADLRAGYPESEILSWDKQEAEAVAGGGPLTDALATARGIDPAELRIRILAKANAYAALSGQIIGIRQSLEDRINAGEVGVSWPGDA